MMTHEHAAMTALQQETHKDDRKDRCRAAKPNRVSRVFLATSEKQHTYAVIAPEFTAYNMMRLTRLFDCLEGTEQQSNFCPV